MRTRRQARPVMSSPGRRSTWILACLAGTPCVRHQELQRVEFMQREVDFCSRLFYLAANGIEGDVADDDQHFVGHFRRVIATNCRTEASRQLPHPPERCHCRPKRHRAMAATVERTPAETFRALSSSSSAGSKRLLKLSSVNETGGGSDGFFGNGAQACKTEVEFIPPSH
jgi:hypothetical protein